MMAALYSSAMMQTGLMSSMYNYIIGLKALTNFGNNRKDIKADVLKDMNHNCIPIVKDGQFAHENMGKLVAIIAAKA